MTSSRTGSQIQRVRVSVIALIPPADGVHATLSSTGISRVVIGPDVFQTVVLRRDPESVSFTSPIGMSGTIELEPQPGDLRQPFEDHGVDTFWELRMPKAANTFDYQTMADVMVTMDYTALEDIDYRMQVIQGLSALTEAERLFSFREEFADAWYDLHNPELLEESQRMLVKVRTTRSDFPPNLDRLRIDNVLLYFVRAAGMTREIPVSGLRFTETGSAAPGVGGAAMTVDGTVSTRRGNGASWRDMVGRQPVGDWGLELPRTADAVRWFKDEQITDILLVVSYSGRPPAWPE